MDGWTGVTSSRGERGRRGDGTAVPPTSGETAETRWSLSLGRWKVPGQHVSPLELPHLSEEDCAFFFRGS